MRISSLMNRNLHSNMVRLKGKGWCDAEIAEHNLHSNMVRLKAYYIISVWFVSWFTFQYGKIKRASTVC